jgi:double-stranded uracil-DNA glycosylase
VVRFSRAELESFRDAVVPDLVGPGTRLLFVGINPGLRTAAIQTHFGKPGNRFWPALLHAGIIEEPVDVTDPMTDEVKAALVAGGIGISNVVPRATARADELTPAELRAGADRLLALVEDVRPRVVAVLGITAYRTAFGRPKAVPGRQAESMGPAELWVVPNPSGLNAHETVDSLAAAYAGPARAAGIIR